MILSRGLSHSRRRTPVTQFPQHRGTAPASKFSAAEFWSIEFTYQPIGANTRGMFSQHRCGLRQNTFRARRSSYNRVAVAVTVSQRRVPSSRGRRIGEPTRQKIASDRYRKSTSTTTREITIGDNQTHPLRFAARTRDAVSPPSISCTQQEPSRRNRDPIDGRIPITPGERDHHASSHHVAALTLGSVGANQRREMTCRGASRLWIDFAGKVRIPSSFSSLSKERWICQKRRCGKKKRMPTDFG